MTSQRIIEELVRSFGKDIDEKELKRCLNLLVKEAQEETLQTLIAEEDIAH